MIVSGAPRKVLCEMDRPVGLKMSQAAATDV